LPSGTAVYHCVPKGLETSDPVVMSAGAAVLSTGNVPSTLCSNTAAATTAANAQVSLAAVPTGSAGAIASTGHCSLIILAFAAAPTANTDGSTAATAYVNIFACPLLSGPDANELTYLCGQVKSAVTKSAPALSILGTNCLLVPTAAKKRSLQDASYNYQTTFNVSSPVPVPSPAPASSSSMSSFAAVPVASVLSIIFLIMFALRQ